MSTFDLPGKTPWDKRPTKHNIEDATVRSLLITKGRLTSTESINIDGEPAYKCQLNDTTGTIALIFLAREEVPGLKTGTVCSIEGTVGRNSLFGLYILNPFYKIEAE